MKIEFNKGQMIHGPDDLVTLILSKDVVTRILYVLHSTAANSEQIGRLDLTRALDYLAVAFESGVVYGDIYEPNPPSTKKQTYGSSPDPTN